MKAKLLHDPRPKVFHNNIGFFSQLQKNFLTFPSSQVKSKALLIPIGRQKMGALSPAGWRIPSSDVVSDFWWFDLNDFSTKIR